MNKKLKENAIKALVFFFLISAVLTVVFRLSDGGVFRKAESFDEYELRFVVKDISSNSVRYFSEGNRVTAEGGLVLGTIGDLIEVRPAQVYVSKSDGTVALVEYPENSRVDVYGSILSYGKNDGGFLINGVKHIASGDSFFISTEQLDILITITEIVKK